MRAIVGGLMVLCASSALASAHPQATHAASKGAAIATPIATPLTADSAAQPATPVAAAARRVPVRNIQLLDSPDSTRLVIDVGAQLPYSVFTLSNPDRVVVDLPSSSKPARLPAIQHGGLVKALRTGPRDGGLRIVLDTSRLVAPNAFTLPSSGNTGYRVVVDLGGATTAASAEAVPAAATPTAPVAPAARPAGSSARPNVMPTPVPAAPLTHPAKPLRPYVTAAASPEASGTEASLTPAVTAAAEVNNAASRAPAPASVAVPAVETAATPSIANASSGAALGATIPVRAASNGMSSGSLSSSSTVELRQKPIVIAIDAGHGGVDPGAHGPDGIEEKAVTLAIARRLARLVDDQPGMRAVLTRDSDTFVDLRRRTVIAREAEADLFISIHCNALRDPSMRGTAVYVLSDHGATSEQARWLASRENSADMVGGVTLQDKDNQVAAVLLDISQTATMEASFDLGGRMLNSMGRINRLQKPQVQQAGFLVLKSPDIPSVLVETAYITNPSEERMLADASNQERIASSLLDGIRGYFSHYRPLEQVVVNDRPRRPSNQGHSVPVRLTKNGGKSTRGAAVVAKN